MPHPAAQAPIILGLAGLIMYLFNKLYSIKKKIKRLIYIFVPERAFFRNA
jgi:hypothetical protein